jgi:putative transposase
MSKTYTQLYYHLVFSTKDRQAWLAATWREELWAVIGEIVSNQGGLLLSRGGVEDHVHLLVGLRAAPSLAEVVKAVKGATSRWINQYKLGGEFAWQVGYAAFTVSHGSLARVMRYLENQASHHARVDPREEFTRLIERHGLAE